MGGTRAGAALSIVLILCSPGCGRDQAGRASDSPSPGAASGAGGERAPRPPGEAVVVVAAGDIASCSSSGDEATAELIDALPLATVLTLGDNAYEAGRAREYADCYGPSWGRHKARTRPVPGNHDYRTSGASGYFGYFGASAGQPTQGYYSYDLGAWHVVALNSNIGMAAGSRQERWLRADLAAHPARCTLAYWHHPRFSSAKNGNTPATQPLWQALYEAGADLILVAHDHTYERFAPQTPAGAPDPAHGIRQFVVGTGGRTHYSLVSRQPQSEVFDRSTFGVLKVNLETGGYAWEFLPVAGGSFTDHGSDRCHGPATESAPMPTPPSPADTTSPPGPTQVPAAARGCPGGGYLRLVNVSTEAEFSSALSNAQAGDQIRLAAGTYGGATSWSQSGTAGAPIVVCGLPGVGPVIKGGMFSSTGSYLVYTGLIFEGADAPESKNNVYLHNCHDVTFTGNEIRGGHYHAGLSVDEAHHMTVTSNYIHDNGHDTSHDHGIYFKTTTGPGNVIAGNLLVRNAARGISLHDNSGTGVFDVLVAHNTMVGNGSTGLLVNDGDRNIVVNNIASGNGDKTGQDQIRVLKGNNNQVRNNLTWSATGSRAGIENATSSPMSGNKVGNPLFQSDYRDLRLRSGSPAIDMGLTGYTLTWDYEGKTRSGAPDAGAYEYSP